MQSVGPNIRIQVSYYWFPPECMETRYRVFSCNQASSPSFWNE